MDQTHPLELYTKKKNRAFKTGRGNKPFIVHTYSILFSILYRAIHCTWPDHSPARVEVLLPHKRFMRTLGWFRVHPATEQSYNEIKVFDESHGACCGGTKKCKKRTDVTSFCRYCRPAFI